MTSLQTTVKRSASAGANKKRRLRFFHRIGSPPSRNRPSSEAECQQPLVSGQSDEENDMNDSRYRSQTYSVVRTVESPEACSEPDPMRLHHFSSRAVAEELCLLDGEMVRRIEPEELHNGAWMKKEVSPLLLNLMAKNFNTNGGSIKVAD